MSPFSVIEQTPVADSFKSLLTDGISLREIVPGDYGFLRSIYRSTRNDIQNSSIDPRSKALVLNQQFQSQNNQFRTDYPNAIYSIICKFGQAAGCLYIDFGDTEVRLVDMTLAQEFQRQGIGRQLLKNLQRVALQQKLPLRLRIASEHDGLRWCKKLGFETVGNDSTHCHLEWDSIDRVTI